jgi:hypothetical protein
MTHLTVPATNTVVVSRGEEITNFHGGTEIYADQYFKFQYEDMVVDRIDYDLKLGKVIGSAPRVLATETLVNKSASEQEISFSISETQTHTSKFEYSTALTVSVGATFKGMVQDLFCILYTDPWQVAFLCSQRKSFAWTSRSARPGRTGKRTAFRSPTPPISL